MLVGSGLRRSTTVLVGQHRVTERRPHPFNLISFHHLRSSTSVSTPCLSQAPFRRSPVVFFLVLLPYSPSLAVIFSIEQLSLSPLRLFRRPLLFLLHLGRKLKTIYHRIEGLISAISSTIAASTSSRLFLQPLRLQLLIYGL
ncbi:hypothetical protein LXL04_012585 [Taraxacum kok-saghyz]